MSSQIRTSKALAARTAELAFAVPEVIAHRTLRAMTADHGEFHRMGAEKLVAFSESWIAMMVQSFWETQRLAWALPLSLWTHQSASKQLADAALNIAGAGLQPIHRRAVTNARRLRRR